MEGSIGYRILTEADHDEVWEIVMTVYRTGDPELTVSEFSEDDMKKYLGHTVKESLIQQASLCAFDEGTNQIVAIRLSLLGRYERDDSSGNNESLPLNVRQQIASVDYMMDGKKMSEAFDTNDYMYYALLCCRPQYGRRGIATELYRRSEEIARQEGCKVIIIATSSVFTQRIAKKLGFVTKRSVSYSEYVDPYTGVKIFEHLCEPHTRMTLEVKDLTQ